MGRGGHGVDQQGDVLAGEAAGLGLETQDAVGEIAQPGVGRGRLGDPIRGLIGGGARVGSGVGNDDEVIDGHGGGARLG